MSKLQEKPPKYVEVLAYFGHLVSMFFAHLQEFLINWKLVSNHFVVEPGRKGYVPLYQDYFSFYNRHVFRKMADNHYKPISSSPDSKVTILERETPNHGWSFRLTGRSHEMINVGSYNYLGFGQNKGPCTDAAEEASLKYGLGLCSPQQELGRLEIHDELDKLTARFLRTEDAITFAMGFATNTTNIPAIASKGCLILSDELNHASLVLGCRLSGATIRVFKHNDVSSLERLLRNGIISGQPKTGRAWKKVIIVVEGIYSMEGTIVSLPEIIRLKKKYKAYLYVDEAHSIGALGPQGRGVVDHFSCDPNDVDILMGTFSKSFASVGGYIAGKKTLIDHIRRHSHSLIYGTGMAAPVAQQILSSMTIIMGEDGTNEGEQRLKQLSRNTFYFRNRLREMGFILYGDDSSPVVPVLLYMAAKTRAISQLLAQNGIAVVVCGFPAAPVLQSRARFCLSSSHTKEMLDKVLNAMDKVGDQINIKYSRLPRCKHTTSYPTDRRSNDLERNVF